MPRMSGTERQPSHPSSISSVIGVTTGLTSTVRGMAGASGYRGLPCTSITQICLSTCTCGAASPAPVYSRMVSTRSSMKRCVSGDRISSRGTGSDGWRSTGCPRRATLSMAISGILCPRVSHGPLARSEAQDVEGDHGLGEALEDQLAHGLHRDEVLEGGHQRLRDEDLPGLGLRAEA